MKVALIGNMNNNFFSITRYLRDLGIDAELFLLDEHPHFMPDADSFTDDYKEYTNKLNWPDFEFWKIKKYKKEILKDIKDYDFIIACHTAPAYLYIAGRDIDIFIPYGDDIHNAPFYDNYRCNIKKVTLIEIFSDLYWNYKRYKWAQYQRRGIKRASYFNCDLSNKESEDIIYRLKIKGKRITTTLPFIYTPVYNIESIKNYYHKSKWYPDFKKIRDRFDFIIFHHSRHSWIQYPDKWSYKGNEKLFKGFAGFIKKKSNIRSCIVTFEYGPDIDNSKDLIKELGIENNIIWFPVIPRKEVMVGLSIADLGAGEFGLSWLSYGTIYEFMAMEVPSMHYRNDKFYIGKYPELYPMINAHSSEEITEKLLYFTERTQELKEIGKKACQWFLKHAVEKPINEYLGIIKEKIANDSNNRT